MAKRAKSQVSVQPRPSETTPPFAVPGTMGKGSRGDVPPTTCIARNCLAKARRRAALALTAGIYGCVDQFAVFTSTLHSYGYYALIYCKRSTNERVLRSLGVPIVPPCLEKASAKESRRVHRSRESIPPASTLLDSLSVGRTGGAIERGFTRTNKQPLMTERHELQAKHKYKSWRCRLGGLRSINLVGVERLRVVQHTRTHRKAFWFLVWGRVV